MCQPSLRTPVTYVSGMYIGGRDDEGGDASPLVTLAVMLDERSGCPISSSKIAGVCENYQNTLSIGTSVLGGGVLRRPAAVAGLSYF
ncbi:hypothetical protein, partial [Pseudovibrio sp. W64]|uniref:hypothetical protein n=1 Tax=Pseudovibrio sp. W64 TaxID=1735583 RepID=UPI000AD56060